MIGLNHAVLSVRDLKRSLKFYKSVLGLEEVARLPSSNMVFLRAVGSKKNRDLGLIQLGDKASSAPAKAIRLDRLAWQVKHLEDLAKERDSLQDLGCFLSASDRGASKSIYARDRDGHEFELTWQIPRKDWGDFEHHNDRCTVRFIHRIAAVIWL